MQLNPVRRSSCVVCMERVLIPLLPIRRHLDYAISKELVMFSPSKGLNDGSKMLIFLL